MLTIYRQTRMRVRLCVFLAAAVLAVSSVVPLYASRGYTTLYVYYSDGSEAEIVGEGFIDCEWDFSQLWGTSTSYYDYYDDPC